jgi:hypothetical protein
MSLTNIAVQHAIATKSETRTVRISSPSRFNHTTLVERQTNIRILSIAANFIAANPITFDFPALRSRVHRRLSSMSGGRIGADPFQRNDMIGQVQPPLTKRAGHCGECENVALKQVRSLRSANPAFRKGDSCDPHFDSMHLTKRHQPHRFSCSINWFQGPSPTLPQSPGTLE